MTICRKPYKVHLINDGVYVLFQGDRRCACNDAYLRRGSGFSRGAHILAVTGSRLISQVLPCAQSAPVSQLDEVDSCRVERRHKPCRLVGGILVVDGIAPVSQCDIQDVDFPVFGHDMI